MISIIKYFRILFLSPKITNSILQNFTEDHIQRLLNHNPGGIFTTILTNVTAAYNSFFGDASSKARNIAVQKGKTEAMVASRKALEKLISDNENLAKYTYRNDNETYLEFYPNGLTEYNRADIPTLITIGNRYKSALATHAADFPTGFDTDYDTVYQTYVDNRAAQSGAKSNVSAERSDLAITKPQLAEQLTTNVLTIAQKYVGDESKSALYFNQGIINAAFATAGRHVIAIINPGETHCVFDNISKASLIFIAENDGDEVLSLAFTNSASTPIPSTLPEHQLEVGHEGASQSGVFGWTSNNKYLNITNNGTLVGHYNIRKV